MKRLKGILLSFIIIFVVGSLFLGSSFVSANTQDVDIDNVLNSKSFYNLNSTSECVSVFCGNLQNYASDGDDILLIKMYQDSDNYIELYYRYVSPAVSQLVASGKIQYVDIDLQSHSYTLNNVAVYGFENEKDFFILNLYQVEDGLGRIITKWELNTCELVQDVQYPLVRINYKSTNMLRYQLDYENTLFNAMEFVGNDRTISKSISYYSNYEMVLFTDSNSQSASVWPDFLKEVKKYWEKTLSGLKYSIGANWMDGYNYGYSIGFNEAVKQDVGLSPFWNVISNIFDAVGSVMRIELIPHISLGLIILVPMTIGLVGFILWIWRRH